MMNDQILIYPYDLQFTPILRHRDLFKANGSFTLCSPPGWGLTDKDASYSDGGPSLDTKVLSNFEELLTFSDTVWFTESENKIAFNEFLYFKIQQAIKESKNIICTIDLNEKITDIKDACNKRNVHFEYNLTSFNLSNIEKQIELSYKLGNHKLCRFNTPIVFVAGLTEKLHKFEIQLVLRELLQKMGYKVSQIGSRNFCEMLGFHSFPRFMYSNSVSESTKVLLFNNYVKKIELEEAPDIILIGIPGGIMPLYDDAASGFGILAFEISQAVVPDFTVFSVPFEDQLDKDYFRKISRLLKYRFGLDVSCFNIANKQVDWVQVDQEGKESYCKVHQDLIEKKIKDLNKDMEYQSYFNILNPDDALKMSTILIDTLCKYAEVQSI